MCSSASAMAGDEKSGGGSDGAVRAWFELVRIPNLFTVPGDVLAGWCLAGGCDEAEVRSVSIAVVAVLLLYVAGMIWNDVADFEEDLEKRPGRPLPSGRIGRGRAFGVGLLVCAAGVGVAIFGGVLMGVAAALLALLVVLYDFGRSADVVWRRWLSFFNMGCCRSASLLLGAVASGKTIAEWSPIIWVAAAGIGIYIMLVSALAFNEGGGARFGRYIGLLLLLLILIQAAFCFYGGCLVVAVAVLVLMPLSKLLARRFYMT